MYQKWAWRVQIFQHTYFCTPLSRFLDPPLWPSVSELFLHTRFGTFASSHILEACSQIRRSRGCSLSVQLAGTLMSLTLLFSRTSREGVCWPLKRHQKWWDVNGPLFFLTNGNKFLSAHMYFVIVASFEQWFSVCHTSLSDGKSMDGWHLSVLFYIRIWGSNILLWVLLHSDHFSTYMYVWKILLLLLFKVSNGEFSRDGALMLHKSHSL